MKQHQYFTIYKPFGYLSQFSKELPEHQVLAELYDFPKDVYPVGRLDRDSEGLLLLTNDKSLNDRLLNPQNKHWRTYWVQVENIPTLEALAQLRKGVDIKIKKKVHHTLPTRVELFDAPPPVLDRVPPIRFRANIPTAWLALQLQEGKNRQVRRMCAKVGFPVLRLIRHAIEDLNIADYKIGEVRPMEAKTLMKKLKL